MSRIVVVPLSPALFVPRQIPWLVELGRRSDVVFHLLDLRAESDGVTPWEDDAGAQWRLQGRKLTRTAGARRQAYLESVADQLGEVLGSMRVRMAVRRGDMERELAAYAADHSAGLVVIGVEGLGAAAEAATKAVAERVAAASGAAVFLVASSPEGVRGTLVSALDGAEAARAGLELALSAARIAGADELLVQALPSGPFRGGRRASPPPPTRAHAQPR